MQDVLLGYALITAGGICAGIYGLPSKFVSKKMEWEHLWGLFFLIATVGIPLLCGPLLIKGLFEIYRTAGVAVLLGPLLFGFFWGLGSTCTGLAFGLIGLSLTCAINAGGQIAFGLLGPTAAAGELGTLLTPHGTVLLCGAAMSLVGVVICTYAGLLKSKSGQESDSPQSIPRKKMVAGLLIATLSGALCACWSVGAMYGAMEGGVNKVAAASLGPVAQWKLSMPTTFLCLLGGSIGSCGLCAFKLTKNKTWGGFLQPAIIPTLFLALIMAVLHDLCVSLYGAGADKIQGLGNSVGYAILISTMIIAGNLGGLLTSEWRGTSRLSKCCMLLGIFTLIVGVITLSAGNYFVPTGIEP